MSIEKPHPEKFDRRTNEGKRKDASQALTIFALEGNVGKMLSPEKLPKELKSFISIPSDAKWGISVSLEVDPETGEEEVRALKIKVYGDQTDLHEFKIEKGSYADRIIKEKKKELLEKRKKALVEFAAYAKDNINKSLGEEEWKEYGRLFQESFDLGFSLPEDGSWIITEVKGPGNKVAVDFHRNDGVLVDKYEFSLDPEDMEGNIFLE